ncbi:MAG: aspartate/glutamate racemase family protein [Alphaproteobacteria bacterium]|nr:aspartate/glutamate racemase family protein [Alphaproteobacteria bacterium]
MDGPARHIGVLEPGFDRGIGTRARIGLIALATDHTVEDEFRELIRGDGVAFFTTRVLNDPTVTPETLKAMEPRLRDSAATLLPGTPFDVIAYACTSASLLIGHEGVEKAIHQAHPEAKVATTMAAVAAALHRRQAKRIAMVTPYIGAINEAMADYLEADGFTLIRAASFNEPDDNNVARLSAEAIWGAVKELGQAPEVEAVFVSCTNIRAVGHIHEWEAEIGKPIVSSNIALAERCLTLAGL